MQRAATAPVPPAAFAPFPPPPPFGIYGLGFVGRDRVSIIAVPDRHQENLRSYYGLRTLQIFGVGLTGFSRAAHKVQGGLLTFGADGAE